MSQTISPKSIKKFGTFYRHFEENGFKIIKIRQTTCKCSFGQAANFAGAGVIAFIVVCTVYAGPAHAPTRRTPQFAVVAKKKTLLKYKDFFTLDWLEDNRD